MKMLELAFNGRVSHTICAFPHSDTSVSQASAFVNAFTEEEYDRLPSVDPVMDYVPYFETADEAVAHFKEHKT